MKCIVVITAVRVVGVINGMHLGMNALLLMTVQVVYMIVLVFVMVTL
jgi:hypothetical protein